MLIHGYHPVREALRHRPHEVRRVVVAQGRGGVKRDKIQALADRHRVPVEEAPRPELDKMARGGTHNGFLAEMAKNAEPAAGQTALSPSAGSGGGDPNLIVLLEDVQDPRNLGAVLRVCEGAGVGRVLIRDRGSAPITATVVKTSAGAAEYLGLERITNSAATMARLKDDGYWIYGAAGDEEGG
jgi:23S rRNA (guanosine2251-2'-O)-methyltransferase